MLPCSPTLLALPAGAQALRHLPGMARRLCAVHLLQQGEERAEAPQRLGHAQHQQPQLPDPEEVLPGGGGVRPELRSARRGPAAASPRHMRQGSAEAAK